MSAAAANSAGQPEKDAAAAAGAAPSSPFLRVVKGNPTPEQVGILTAVFATANANAEIAALNPEEGIRDEWGSPAERTRGVFWSSTSAFLNPNLR